MSLYELDPGTSDELVQTVYFPEVLLGMECDIWGCRPASSGWLQPSFYDSPVNPPKIYAEMAVIVNSAFFVDTSRACAAAGPSLQIVSAASFRGASVAPDSIVSAFGRGLSTTTRANTATVLPTTLGGTQVTVTDATGVSRSAAIFYVSPEQVNFHVPPATALGQAQIVVSRADTVVSRGTVLISAVAPAIFAANASGAGVASATAVAISANGSQQAVSVFQCGTFPGSCQPVPIDVASRTVVLSLYGTGIRLHSGLDSVQVTIEDIPAQILYAGAQGQYVGLDQVNVLVPSSVSGRGIVDVVLSVSGIVSNTVTIAVQ